VPLSDCAIWQFRFHHDWGRRIRKYKCDNFYAPHSEGAIAWDDPDLGIDWRIPADRVILSEKDSRHPRLKDLNL
jgi:dTDP-4-dehydrorhamnose 3,5-epimerase-like enzyme